jgi:hypothetical protein
MDTLLKAKHWQIFLFAFGIPWLLMMVVMGFGFADFFSMMKANPDPEDMAIVMSDFISKITVGILPLALLSAIVNYGWLYAVNQRISPMAPDAYRPNTNLVSLAIGCIILFTFINAGLTAYMYSNGMEQFLSLGNNSGELSNMGSTFLIMYLGSLFTSLANFGLAIYVSYQLSRAVKGAELQRYLRTDDTIGPFFAFVFLFIGIWFIQPIVNKLHADGPGGGNNLDKSLILD